MQVPGTAVAAGAPPAAALLQTSDARLLGGLVPVARQRLDLLGAGRQRGRERVWGRGITRGRLEGRGQQEAGGLVSGAVDDAGEGRRARVQHTVGGRRGGRPVHHLLIVWEKVVGEEP